MAHSNTCSQSTWRNFFPCIHASIYVHLIWFFRYLKKKTIRSQPKACVVHIGSRGIVKYLFIWDLLSWAKSFLKPFSHFFLFPYRFPSRILKKIILWPYAVHSWGDCHTLSCPHEYCTAFKQCRLVGWEYGTGLHLIIQSLLTYLVSFFRWPHQWLLAGSYQRLGSDRTLDSRYCITQQLYAKQHFSPTCHIWNRDRGQARYFRFTIGSTEIVSRTGGCCGSG